MPSYLAPQADGGIRGIAILGVDDDEETTMFVIFWINP